jgi:hypothetical protein
MAGLVLVTLEAEESDLDLCTTNMSSRLDFCSLVGLVMDKNLPAHSPSPRSYFPCPFPEILPRLIAPLPRRLSSTAKRISRRKQLRLFFVHY